MTRNTHDGGPQVALAGSINLGVTDPDTLSRLFGGLLGMAAVHNRGGAACLYGCQELGTVAQSEARPTVPAEPARNRGAA
jgi:hypothetical protein